MSFYYCCILQYWCSEISTTALPYWKYCVGIELACFLALAVMLRIITLPCYYQLLMLGFFLYFQFWYKMSFKFYIKPAFPLSMSLLMLAQEKVKVRTENEKQLQEVTRYCIEQKCKGYQAVSSGLSPLIKGLHTINRHLEDS